MPDHKLHATLDYMLFGRAFPEIHKFMDSAQPYLQSNHRILYHDMGTVNELAELHGEMAGHAAYTHIMLDWVSDRVGQEKAVPVLLKLIQMGEIYI
jgi:hypothetical protein